MMNRRSQRTRWAGFTLIEMLIVVGVMMAVLSMLGVFFADLWKGTHRAIRRSQDNQQVLLIQKKWQQELRGTTADSWRVGETGFSAGTVRVWQEKKRIFFADGGRTNAMLLPAHAAITSSVERPAGGAPCAVLRLEWPSEYLAGAQPTDVRFVACGRGP